MIEHRFAATVRGVAGAAACVASGAVTLAGLLTPLSPACAAPPTPAQQQALANAFDKAVAAGFEGEVLMGDLQDIWFEQAAGRADRERGVPHRTGAVWRWASVSKQVTAAMTLQAVAESRLTLDDTVQQHLPTFSGPTAAKVTVRQLLQHTAGLPNPDDTPEVGGVPSFYLRQGEDLQPAALAYCAAAPKRAPGERFEYNNCDTLVLSAILAAVEKQTPAELLKRRVAQPLGLKTLRLIEGSGRERSQAVAYDAAGQPVPQPQVANFGLSGAMEGSARDMLAFDRALLSDRMLPRALRDVMWTGEPKLGYVALGAWAFEARLAGCKVPVKLVERRGDVGGVQVRNLIAPQSGASLVIFTNLAELHFGEIWQGRGLSYDLAAAAFCHEAEPRAERQPSGG
jgi:CubicO group peptidase (beta-lactamase class C family)